MTVHPVAPMLIAAIALPVLPLFLRRLACITAPVLSLLIVADLGDGEFLRVSFLEFDLVLLRSDPLSRIFGLVFALAATTANLYGWHRSRVSEQMAALLYAGGGLAVVFAGDLLSMLFAWEVMAVASAILVFGGGAAGSIAAGQRYLIVHLFAGSLLLIGVAGILAEGGGIAFDALSGGRWPAWAILASLCINAAVPPVHAWLPDAYPRASIAGSVFLSTFTTKAAVYCLARGFAGEEVLIWAGAVMAVYGVVFATMEDDMRRLLSFHIVSQVGYMVCGIGVGSALAVNGAVAHAVCHILYKALLFMAVGAVVYRTGRNRLSELGGLRAVMPRTLTLYMVGALSISGAPLFNGFVSKPLVLTGAAEAHHLWPVFLLTVASVGTFLSVGLKLPWFAWGRPSGGAALAGSDAPPHMMIAMGILAALCVGLGVWPQGLYDRLPVQPVSYDAYTAYHVFEILLAMAFCGLAFSQSLRLLEPHGGRTVDLDALYRAPGRWLESVASGWLDRTSSRMGSVVDSARAAVVEWVRDPTTHRRSSDGAEKPYFDENSYRPALAQSLSWIIAVFAFCAASLALIAR